MGKMCPTFSDDLVRSTSDKERYKRCITDYSTTFRELLNSTLNKEYKVNTALDYQNEYTRQNSGYPGIVAVPICKELCPDSDESEHNPNIIPGIPEAVSLDYGDYE